MATIKVNSQSMRTKAQNFASIAESINGYMQEMKGEIERLEEFWKGGAAEDLVFRFTALAKDFETIVNTINNYATFLRNAAEAYDNAETVNRQGVSQTQEG